MATAEDVNVAKGALRPRLFLNAGVGRERTDSENVNGGEPISLTRREAGINLIWALYSPAERGEMARRMGISEGAAAGIADIEQQVALQASTAYTNLWRAGTQYEIAQQARQAHETLVDQIGRRVETGVSGEAELIQVQGRLSLSQSNESAALNALQDARANYRRVVGKLPDFEVAKTMLDWDRPPFLDMAVQNAFRDHPIIKVAEADIQEATALGQSAQGSQLPRITLELGANLNRDLDGTPGTSKDRFAMLRMNWDLYNGGSNMAAELAAGFRLSEAEHLLNDAQREVVELAHQAWNAYMTTKQQLVYLDMFVESAVNTREAYAQHSPLIAGRFRKCWTQRLKCSMPAVLVSRPKPITSSPTFNWPPAKVSCYRLCSRSTSLIQARHRSPVGDLEPVPDSATDARLASPIQLTRL